MIKKIFIICSIFSIILINLTSCDTLTRYTAHVSVDRNLILVISNQTGYTVSLTAPVYLNIDNGSSTQLQPADTNGSIDINYSIESVKFTEQMSMNNADATVILTKRPPAITVVNQTGYPIALVTPTPGKINNGGSVYFLSPALNQTVEITYQIE
ncbi:MAG: hypothetical protein FWD78_08645 [Treponema sp.]|nr:hypothetical protein [Treponema sp.]